MILKEVLHIFHSELDTIYGKNEVDSFFNLLLEHHLNLDRISLILNPNYLLLKEKEVLFLDALKRLILEEPIQYIIGKTEFHGLIFQVNQHTLIPRPETEELVSWILDEQLKNNNQEITILDVGTGSGCIAIALAKKLPNARVYALDVSEKALEIAKSNAHLHAVEIEFLHEDILTWENSQIFNDLQFDIIVSNPPYVRNQEKQEMKPNVLNHEPDLALFVTDENSLVFYSAISKFAVDKLRENGLLFFEINQYLGDEMIQLLEEDTFKTIVLKKDIFGNDRMIKGQKITNEN